jgi:trans-aconitate methyltransferase
MFKKIMTVSLLTMVSAPSLQAGFMKVTEETVLPNGEILKEGVGSSSKKGMKKDKDKSKIVVTRAEESAPKGGFMKVTEETILPSGEVMKNAANVTKASESAPKGGFMKVTEETVLPSGKIMKNADNVTEASESAPKGGFMKVSEETVLPSGEVIKSGPEVAAQKMMSLADTAKIDPEIGEKSKPEHDSTKKFFHRIRQDVTFPSHPTIILMGWDTGKTSEFIAEEVKDAKIINFTLSKEIRDFAVENHSHTRVQPRHGNIMMPQKDLEDSADFIYSSWVVGFIPQHKQVDSLKHMRQMLKNNGTCAVLFPMKGSQFAMAIDIVADKPVWKSKFRRLPIMRRITYTPQEYAQLMKIAGYKDVNAEKYEYARDFKNREELETFVHTGISRYLPYLSQSEAKKFIVEIADEYISTVSPKSNSNIPYRVDMLLAVGGK